MSRIVLAFGCFFRLLFGGKLPAKAAEYLPDDVARPALPDKQPDEKPDKKPDKTTDAKADKSSAKADKSSAKADKSSAKADKSSDKPSERKPAASPVKLGDHHRDGALAFLALLQREGRLIDFLRESLDDYEDSDIGAAARDVHRGCKKVLDDHFTLEAVMPGEEDDDINVPKGFDPGEIRLIGDVEGDPPFKGTLRHHGWRATKVSLPKLSEGVDRHVVSPAEVEIAQ